MNRPHLFEAVAVGVAAAYLIAAVAAADADPIPTGATVMPVATGTNTASDTGVGSMVHYRPNTMADEPAPQVEWPSWGVEQRPPGAANAGLAQWRAARRQV